MGIPREMNRILSKQVSVLLLAAGLSSRFGSNKMLASLEEEGGLTLIERALETIRRTRADEIVIVLGSESAEVLRKLRGKDFRVIVNDRFRDGLSTSLKAGLKAVSPKSDAVVVVLADLPFVTAGVIDELIARYLATGCEVVTSVSSSSGLLGPPVLFDRRTFPEIENLQGDVGAKSIVLRHGDAERVEVAEELLLDVDTRRDLERARRMSRESERTISGKALPRRGRGRARAAGARGRARSSSG